MCPFLSLHEAEPRTGDVRGLGRLPVTASILVDGDAREGVTEAGFDLLDLNRFDAKSEQTRIIPVNGFGFIFFRSLRRGIGSQAHGNVDVFKYPARCDAENSVAGFHQVVALSSAVLAAKVIGEAETGIELFGFD